MIGGIDPEATLERRPARPPRFPVEVRRRLRAGVRWTGRRNAVVQGPPAGSGREFSRPTPRPSRVRCVLFLLALPAVGAVVHGTAVHSQGELRVQRGETRTVTDAAMVVDKWVMEDNSTLEIAPGISDWRIEANRASFGKNTKISGAGSPGDGAADSQGASGTPGTECRDGGHGGAGLPGSAGSNGVNVSMTIGLVGVEDLVIDVSGGKGGDGGTGGTGGQGGRASCGRICSGQEGGSGGPGGSAGNGGRGGNVTVSYWLAGQTPVFVGSTSGKGLRVEAEGGEAGAPGPGGPAGSGGAGKRCGLYKRSGGSPGSKGPDGGKGISGASGAVLFEVLPSPGDGA